MRFHDLQQHLVLVFSNAVTIWRMTISINGVGCFEVFSLLTVAQAPTISLLSSAPF